MLVGKRLGGIMAACAVGLALQAISPAVSHADEVCPAGTYWDVYTNQCIPYSAVDVYLNPTPILGPNPVLGPAGPVGVGGVVGPVGPGPVGPGPVGPGGPGRR
ncbi:hypothetical protein [Mycolicibacterium pulveris]|uniref:hypothetical protein n=1 Tax=Mycolicibacterium pulveris TaxID=36813 RepID=UPI003CF35BF0